MVCVKEGRARGLGTEGLSTCSVGAVIVEGREL